jgi:hypothetical protein
MHEYQLRYLPQFHLDMMHHVEYIANRLKNPQAAGDLIDATEKAILERLPDAEAFEPYHSRKDRQYPYYRIYVKNFIVFYVVIPEDRQKVVEIRRFVYAKSNWRRTI